LRDSEPYKLVPYCLDCAALVGANGRSDTGHLIVPEIEYRFYCKQPNPLPSMLLPHAWTKTDWNLKTWKSTTHATLNPITGRYHAMWHEIRTPIVEGDGAFDPYKIDWERTQRPPRAGETWSTQHHGDVFVQDILKWHYPFIYQCGAANYSLEDFTRMVRKPPALNAFNNALNAKLPVEVLKLNNKKMVAALNEVTHPPSMLNVEALRAKRLESAKRILGGKWPGKR